MTRVGITDLSAILACALLVACGPKNEGTTAPSASVAPQCPVSASGEPLPIQSSRIDPTRANQPLLDRLRDAAPDLMLEDVSVSFTMVEDDGGPMTSDADRQRRLQARQRTAKAVRDAVRPDLVALGVVILSEGSISPRFHVRLPVCLLPTLFSDQRIDQIGLGTKAVRDGTVKLDQ